MAITLTVNGVTDAFRQSTFSYDKSVYGRATAHLTIQSVTGTNIIERDDEIIVLKNGVVQFAGLVQETSLSGIGGEQIIGVDNVIDCVDFSIYGQWRYFFNAGIVAGNVKAALTVIVASLTPYGVSLDPAQVNGPTLPQLSPLNGTISSVLDLITELSGYTWEIYYDTVLGKLLRAYLPGGTSASFNITGTSTEVIGDISVEPSDKDYANRVFVLFGQGTKEITDVITGDGATSSWAIDYFPLIAHRGYVIDDTGVLPNVILTLSINAAGTAFYDYDTTTGILTRYINGTLTPDPLPNAQVANFIYTSQFPVLVEATNAASPVREAVIERQDIFDRDVAQALADAALPRYLARPRIAHYQTRSDGLLPGQAQTITASKRGLSAVAGFITDVSAQHEEGEYILYDVTWTEGSELQGSWRDIFPEWSAIGRGGGPTGEALGTPGVGGAPSLPYNSIQTNLAGSFGGSINCTFDQATNSFVMGLGSSIDATNAQSCAAIGDDCHIG